ncbi:hypothetical protein GCM10022393_41240 [Aquimarina addita]|uniref:Cyclic nucleotide-binding domain-containing protein n=1 Tax=Aquimarina addita TaxID=870485 RepID=A0ABP6UXZ4_9FLAO
MKKVLFLLGHLTDLDIEWMIQNGHKKKLKNGQQLIKKGDHIENIYIVLSGQLAISDNGTEIAAIGSGEIVGEMSFLESRPPSVSVIAKELSTVYSISKELMNTKLENDIEFRANFYYSLALFLSDRLRKTTNQFGYESPDEADSIEENVLDGVAQAGARFNQILHKFSEV